MIGETANEEEDSSMTNKNIPGTGNFHIILICDHGKGADDFEEWCNSGEFLEKRMEILNSSVYPKEEISSYNGEGLGRDICQV